MQAGAGYHIFDNGVNPTKAVIETSARRDFGFIGFDYDDMGPGKMLVRGKHARAIFVVCVHFLGFRLWYRFYPPLPVPHLKRLYVLAALNVGIVTWPDFDSSFRIDA